MRIPQTFLPEYEDSEKKLKDLTRYSKKRVKKEKNITCRTREEKKAFLEDFVKKIPGLMEQVKEKMIRTKVETVYLEKQIVEDYSARLELGVDNHLEFHHRISKADLDDKEFYSYDGYATIFDRLNTYPDKENIYYNYAGDVLNSSYRRGKEMHQAIDSFLKKK